VVECRGELISEFSSSFFVHLEPNKLVFRVSINIGYHDWNCAHYGPFRNLHSRIYSEVELRQGRQNGVLQLHQFTFFIQLMANSYYEFCEISNFNAF